MNNNTTGTTIEERTPGPRYRSAEAWTITRLSDPVVEAHGQPAHSRYTETFWLPALGPSATLALFRFADGLFVNPDGFTIHPATFAPALGLTWNTHRPNNTLNKAVGRLIMFGLARPQLDGLEVRTTVPTVPNRLSERWPEWLRNAHTEQTRPAR